MDIPVPAGSGFIGKHGEDLIVFNDPASQVVDMRQGPNGAVFFIAGDGTSGCFLPGPVDGPVAAEACESDGTLTGYHAALGLIHNISRDHGEVDALMPQFEAFAKRSGRLLVNSASPEAALLGRAVGAHSYGAGPDADTPLEVTSTGPHRARGVLRLSTGPLVLDVPQPGLHNLENAAAAALIALDLGIAPRRGSGRARSRAAGRRPAHATLRPEPR